MCGILGFASTIGNFNQNWIVSILDVNIKPYLDRQNGLK